MRKGIRKVIGPIGVRISRTAIEHPRYLGAYFETTRGGGRPYKLWRASQDDLRVLHAVLSELLFDIDAENSPSMERAQ